MAYARGEIKTKRPKIKNNVIIALYRIFCITSRLKSACPLPEIRALLSMPVRPRPGMAFRLQADA
jgi:hypothetical protein